MQQNSYLYFTYVWGMRSFLETSFLARVGRVGSDRCLAASDDHISSDPLVLIVSSVSFTDSYVYLKPIPYHQYDRGEEQHWRHAGSVGWGCMCRMGSCQATSCSDMDRTCPKWLGKDYALRVFNTKEKSCKYPEMGRRTTGRGMLLWLIGSKMERGKKEKMQNSRFQNQKIWNRPTNKVLRSMSHPNFIFLLKESGWCSSFWKEFKIEEPGIRNSE